MLVKKHQKYLLFLKECGMLTYERKESIVYEIKYIFNIMIIRFNKRTINTSNLDDAVTGHDENDDDMNHISLS